MEFFCRDIKSVKSNTMKESSIIFNHVPILRPKYLQLIPSPLCLFTFDNSDNDHKAFSDDETIKSKQYQMKSKKDNAKENHKSTTGLPFISLKNNKKKNNNIKPKEETIDNGLIENKRSSYKKHSILQSLQNKNNCIGNEKESE